MILEISPLKEGKIRRFIDSQGARIMEESNRIDPKIGFIQITFPLVSTFLGEHGVIPDSEFTWTRDQEIRYDDNWNELEYPDFNDENWVFSEVGIKYKEGRTQFEFWKEKGMEAVEVILKKLVEKGVI